jgi:hypothetical protein
LVTAWIADSESLVAVILLIGARGSFFFSTGNYTIVSYWSRNRRIKKVPYILGGITGCTMSERIL